MSRQFLEEDFNKRSNYRYEIWKFSTKKDGEYFRIYLRSMLNHDLYGYEDFETLEEAKAWFCEKCDRKNSRIYCRFLLDKERKGREECAMLSVYPTEVEDEYSCTFFFVNRTTLKMGTRNIFKGELSSGMFDFLLLYWYSSQKEINKFDFKTIRKMRYKDESKKSETPSEESGREQLESL